LPANKYFLLGHGVAVPTVGRSRQLDYERNLVLRHRLVSLCRDSRGRLSYIFRADLTFYDFINIEL